MSEDEPKPRIIVRDRRAFTRDGERRDPDPAPAEEETPAAGPESDQGPEAADAAPETPDESRPEPGRPDDDPRFRQLVQLLSMQAAMLLDRSPREGDDAAARRSEALGGLEATIGLLEMLQTKTRDRLSDADDRFLAQVLFQLRMAYMGLAEAPADGAAEAG